MSLNKVSQRVLDAVYARLSSATDGFNARLAINAPAYNLPIFFQIEWTGTSQNFFFAQINPDMLEQTGIFKYPMACMYIQESGQTGDERFHQFSGVVRCIFEVYLSWKNIRGKQNHEAYANCVEDVVYDVIQRVENQNWAMPLVYNGMIQCRRGPLQFAAENFRQRVGFSMVFQIHQ